jgi:Tn3 transposase DDE domain-containing protein
MRVRLRAIKEELQRRMHEPIPEQGRWSGPVVRGYFAYHCEGQEDQLGALGLVVNIIVLWNTLYVDAILQQLRTEGFPVPPEATCWGGMPFQCRRRFNVGSYGRFEAV